MPDYATLLRDHVTLKVRSIDRIFLQGYVPKLQSVGQVCTFLRWQRGFHIPSSAAFGRIGEQYVKDIQHFAEGHCVPLVHFEKGESKEERVRPLLQQAAKEGGDGRVVLIGVAQEKASAWRSWKAKGQEKAAHPHMEWGRQMTHVNHFYWTTAFSPAPIPHSSRSGVINSAPVPCGTSSGAGTGDCHRLSRRRTSTPATSTSWPSGSSRSRTR